ncbi:MAG: DNA repair protein RadA [Dehalococcoidia bacterium]|nr:DNA repair protein RadA [Chloroflexota bacterium]MCK4242540.1 DNA repair protein RadA [Dehalococcoidia bacterium]
MNKGRSRTVFVCQQCGRESPKWLGRCPGCEGWNTFVETVVRAPTRHAAPSRLPSIAPQELSQVTIEGTPRLTLSSAEFNRVLGGGIVPGSLVLIGGDPGIGKSTLMLQVSAMAAEREGKVIYVSGEESLEQVRLRANRLGLGGEHLFVFPETNLEIILEHIDQESPHLVIIDSIQTVYLDELGGAPGSVGQIRECTMRLMQWAKAAGIPVLLSGHVTKDGAIAGPRVLEHIVDVVLYLEGEPFSTYRLLRSVKNRFGSTNEVGIFEMRGDGLMEVDNPSQVFLAQRARDTVGSAVVPTLEGTRPLLVEIQALSSTTSFGLPRRTANGIDFNRLLLITAVLSKRAGLPLGNQDIIVNVVGGLRVNEPAADLGIALAITSSLRSAAIAPDLVAIGELGLSGELRGVPQLERRLAEAAKLGFGRCLLPRRAKFSAPQGIKPIGVESLREAIRVALAKGERQTS